MFGKILTVDGPVQAPEPDDGVWEEHLHPELTENRGHTKSGSTGGWAAAGFSVRMGAQGADPHPPIL